MSKSENSKIELQAEVLVIGGGPAAAWAAWAAASNGAKVIVVDKGYLGASGAAAASGNGVMNIAPNGERRNRMVAERYKAGETLAKRRWIERVLDQTWSSMPLVEMWGYRFPRENGETIRESYYGPEYLRILRKELKRIGVRILDQSPALELLVDENGIVAGARGVQRQENREWIVKARAVVLATGGCAFLSKALGCNTNTGDGNLMAVEAGGELTGMEFSSQYAISSALNATVTRGVPYAWATYTDEAGNDLGGFVNGRRGPTFLADSLLKGPVYAKLDKATPQVKAVIEKSHYIAFLPLWKAGIDPYTHRFPVTLVLEGTVRGTGGIRIINDDCATTVPGLFAAGDAASREFLAGAGTGGGGPNAAWAISSGQWSGAAAARFAAKLGERAVNRAVHPVGTVGIRSSQSQPSIDSVELIQKVQEEVFPLNKNFYRNEAQLLSSLAQLEHLWKGAQGQPKQDSVRETERSRIASSLVANARWAYFAALNRTETRSMQRRTDYPEADPKQRHYLAVGGLEKLWVRPDPIHEAVADFSNKEMAMKL